MSRGNHVDGPPISQENQPWVQGLYKRHVASDVGVSDWGSLPKFHIEILPRTLIPKASRVILSVTHQLRLNLHKKQSSFQFPALHTSNALETQNRKIVPNQVPKRDSCPPERVQVATIYASLCNVSTCIGRSAIIAQSLLSRSKMLIRISWSASGTPTGASAKSVHAGW